MNYKKQQQNEIIEPIHLVGIGGSGMRPLAELCVDYGIEFSGSDINRSEFTDYLATQADIFIGHSDKNIEQAKTLVVSSAIQDDNPELIAAKKLGLRIAHRSDLLNYFLKLKKGIAVAGTHGKTSTTAMLTHMLSELDLRPSAIVGGKLIEHNRFSIKGDGDYVIAEADESDGTFLKYEPFYSILTNIDKDHLDFYDNMNHVVESFKIFLNNTNEDGSAIICWDNEHCRELAKEINRDFLSFGFSIGSDVRCIEHRHTEKGMFVKIQALYQTIEAEVPLIGKHNVLNILACVALSIKLKIPPAEALDTMENYKGVMRRTEAIYKRKNLSIIDDYAHNPGKIAAVIKSIKNAYPKKDLWVIFENHRYSRLQSMYNEIIHSLSHADHIFVAPIYSAGESEDSNYTPQSISDDIKNILQINAEPYFNDKIVKDLKLHIADRPTILLTVGAGLARNYGIEVRTKLNDQETKNEQESTE